MLDESAIQTALQRKRSLRGFGVDDATGVCPPSTTGTHMVPQQRPTGKILLDENQLEQALKIKAERRRAAEASSDRRSLARSSVDRFLDDDSVPKVNLPKRSRPLRKPIEKTTPSNQATSGTFVSNTQESVSKSASTFQEEPAGNSQKVVKTRKSRTKSVAESAQTEHATNSQSTSQTPAVTRELHTVSPEPIAPQHVVHSTSDASKNVKNVAGGRTIRRVSSKKSPSSTGSGIETTTEDAATTIHENGSRVQGRPSSSIKTGGPEGASSGVQRQVVRKLSKRKSSKQKVISEDPTNNSPSSPPSAQPISVTSANETVPSRSPPKLQPNSSQKSIQTETTQSRRKSARPPLPPKPTNHVPSKGSIHTASTTKPSNNNDSVSTIGDHSTIPTSSDHSQPISWGCIPIPNSSKDHPSSFNSQPPSWSVRNQSKTGFSPNEYITKETMTTYTNNLGGVETVATTTRLFHDKARADPDFKVYFKKIRWEHVRNEFIILANLQVPDRFDESLRGMLEHHCRLLENGADMDRLISIWESAIEASWLENRRDDARQLIVGPSRVIFNLKALERHYAMYQKALRAASRRGGKDSQAGISQTAAPAPSQPPRRGILLRLRRGKQ